MGSGAEGLMCFDELTRNLGQHTRLNWVLQEGYVPISEHEPVASRLSGRTKISALSLFLRTAAPVAYREPPAT